MTRDVFEAAGSVFNWRGPLAYLDAARAAFWIMAGYKNRRLSTWKYQTEKYNAVEAVPVWVSDVFPVNQSIGYPGDPGYEQIIIARNWFVPGYNEEIVY